MNKLIIVLMISSLSISAIAQKTEKEEKNEKQPEVPASVKQAFAKDYPNVKNATWDAEGKEFEAEFKLNGVDCSANYDKTGHRTEVETTIKGTELPKAALDYIGKNYSTYKLKEAAKITNDKNVVSYEAEVELNGKSIDLVFDTNGKFLKKEEGD
jgi:hypothetical protein